MRVDASDAAVGRTIEDLAIRRRTGVTIVAVLRGSHVIVTPDPDLALRAGDELVMACNPADVDGFVRYLDEGA